MGLENEGLMSIDLESLHFPDVIYEEFELVEPFIEFDKSKYY